MSSQSQRFFCEILNAEQKISLPLLSSTDYIPKNVLEQKVLVHRVTLLNVIIVYHCFSSRNYYCFCACFNLIINYRKKLLKIILKKPCKNRYSMTVFSQPCTNIRLNIKYTRPFLELVVLYKKSFSIFRILEVCPSHLNFKESSMPLKYLNPNHVWW